MLGTFQSVLILVAILTSSYSRADLTRTPVAWPDRPYIVHIPPTIGTASAAVILTFHGGSGNNQSVNKITCPGGDETSSECLNAIADREGFVVVYPNGTADPTTCQQYPKLCDVRSWNGGGGANGYACTGSYACTANVDDLSYLTAVMSDLAQLITIDSSRVFAAGISNGAALVERLACKWSVKIAAFADIAGANQYSTSASCSPARPVPVLTIHGTSDPVWPYLGGPSSLALTGNFFSAKQTALDWSVRNSCASEQTYYLPATLGDPARTGIAVFSNCQAGANVIHYFVEGAGHTWPGGWQYLPVSTVGLVSMNFNASEVMWTFFKGHPLGSVPQNIGINEF